MKECCLLALSLCLVGLAPKILYFELPHSSLRPFWINMVDHLASESRSFSGFTGRCCNQDVWIIVVIGHPDYAPCLTSILGAILATCCLSEGLVVNAFCCSNPHQETLHCFRPSAIWGKSLVDIAPELIKRCSDVTNAVCCASNSWQSVELKWWQKIIEMWKG